MKTWLWIIKICLPLKHHFSTSSSWRLSLSKVLKSSSSKQAGHKLGPLDADEPSARSQQLLNELLLKHLPFLFSAAFLVLLLGLKAELESGNARGDCWSAIIHYPLVKVINWSRKSLHMDGHNLFSWKGFPLVNWKMIISLDGSSRENLLLAKICFLE